MILTPYLAQMREIRNSFSTYNINAFISSQDYQDLVASGADPTSTGPQKQDNGIRVATIDNYQGEESDVVIASLVRSNANGDIGFTGDPNRINVLLSRARHGMILIGNLDCLISAKKKQSRETWATVHKLLEADKHVYPAGLPARCESHKTISHLRVPEDFDKFVPDGGCALQCAFQFACGHQCPKKCHPLGLDHAGVICKQKTKVCCLWCCVLCGCCVVAGAVVLFCS